MSQTEVTRDTHHAIQLPCYKWKSEQKKDVPALVSPGCYCLSYCSNSNVQTQMKNRAVTPRVNLHGWVSAMNEQ